MVGVRRANGLRQLRRLVALTIVLAMATAVAPPAAAAPTVGPPIVDGLAGPLGFAVADDGTMHVAQSFAGTLTRVSSNGKRVRDVAVGGTDISGPAAVAVKGNSNIVYLESGSNDEGTQFVGSIVRLRRDGNLRTLGDVAALEVRANPDARNSYGFHGLTAQCIRRLDALAAADETGETPTGSPSAGIVESNPYAVAFDSAGLVVVADAAANAIFTLNKRGNVRTLAVLPPVSVKVTRRIARSNDLPPCSVGSTYNFDPVPTDVELGPDGLIYISSLAGGPEGPGLNTGGVFTLDTRTRELTRIGSGFNSATDLAVTPTGDVYVTELFAGRLSKLVDGGPELVAKLNQPVAVEFARGRLYVAIDPFENGSIITVDL